MVHFSILHHWKRIFSLKVNTLASSLKCHLFHNTNSYQAPPHSSLFTCSLSIADGNRIVTFHWDDILSDNAMHNAIDHYCVTTSPSTICSACNILPSVPYQCPHLQTGHQYSFLVKGVNCEDQQGGNSTFIIKLISEDLIVLIKFWYFCCLTLKDQKLRVVLKLLLCITR